MLGRNRKTLVGVVLVALALLGVAIVEGDLPEALTHVGSLVIALLNRFGAAACLALLYVEESGIPLPVPGDFYVAFLGRLNAGSLSRLLEAWLGIIAVVVAGSSNLYWLARRWGPAILSNPIGGRLLHLDEHRMKKAHAWFDRWGPWAIIFGRHLPGFRIAITVIAASVGVPYRVFAPSVAVSTAIWAAVGLWLGATLGETISGVFFDRGWIYFAGLALAIVTLAAALVFAWRRWGLSAGYVSMSR
jgi:membrane protein DedA with SNARE-associated domain